MGEPVGAGTQGEENPGVIVAHGARAAEPRLTRRRAARHLGLLLAAVLVAGMLGALVWKLSAPTPSVTVSSDGTAAVTNRTMAEYFGMDADFMIIGMFAGLGLGALAWRWLRPLGWPLAFIAVVAGMLAAWVAWRFGAVLGPNHFDERLAQAHGGEQVAIDLTLRTPTAWLFWPLGAVVPILLYSALGHDEDQHETGRPGRPGADVRQRPSHRMVRFTHHRGTELSGTGRQSGPASPSPDHPPRSPR